MDGTLSPATAPAPAAWRPSPVLLDHMRAPRNNGMLLRWSGHAFLRGDCGDEMTMWVRAEGGRIARIGFLTSGCGTSHAAGSMATVLAVGRTLHHALQLGQQEVLAALGGLPADHEHCALLAATTVQLACEDALLRALPGGKG